MHLCDGGHASYGLERETMANKINTVPAKLPETETPTVVDSENPEHAADKKLDRVADRAAHKAAKTEQRYDEDHNVFSN